MSRITCRVWWINEQGKLFSYRAFVTLRECGGVCALYLTYVRKFNWTAPCDETWTDRSKGPALSSEEPWVDHPDFVLEGLQVVESHHSQPCGYTYYRAADHTLIFIERVTEV